PQTGHGRSRVGDRVRAQWTWIAPGEVGNSNAKLLLRQIRLFFGLPGTAPIPSPSAFVPAVAGLRRDKSAFAFTAGIDRRYIRAGAWLIVKKLNVTTGVTARVLTRKSRDLRLRQPPLHPGISRPAR